MTATVIGARTLAQAADNFAALDLALTDEQAARLDQASGVEPIFPSRFIDRPMAQQLIFGTSSLEGVR